MVEPRQLPAPTTNELCVECGGETRPVKPASYRLDRQDTAYAAETDTQADENDAHSQTCRQRKWAERFASDVTVWLTSINQGFLST